jgi:hypothetical protein
MGNPIQGEIKSAYPGSPISALDANRQQDAAWQNGAVFPRPFGYGGRYPGGAVDVPIAQGGATSAATTLYPPWYPFFTQDGSGNYQANFYPGTLGGIVATNTFTPITLTQSDLNYVYAEVSASSAVVTSVTLAASTTYPTLAGSNSGSPPTSFNVPIGIFDLSQSPPKAYNIVGFGNIWLQPIVTLWDTVNTGALLTAPFTGHYNWEWGAGGV